MGKEYRDPKALDSIFSRGPPKIPTRAEIVIDIVKKITKFLDTFCVTAYLHDGYMV
jgi:hypothetical protein